MRILLIGGTGTISSAITRLLAKSDHELWLLNRGNRKDETPQGVRQTSRDLTQFIMRNQKPVTTILINKQPSQLCENDFIV